MTNIAVEAIRTGIDMAATDTRVAGAIVAAGLVLGAAGILWTKWREKKKRRQTVG